MSDKSVEPSGLADAVIDILNSYTSKVVLASAEAAKKTANDCVEKIKANIDRSNIQGTGAYRDSWKADLQSSNSYETIYVVHAGDPYYRLAHLLEKGHNVVVHGEAVESRTRKFPHIRPAVRDISKEFGDNLQIGMKK